MTDDPFDRAVERVEAAQEHADAERRGRRYARWSSGQRRGFRIHASVFVAVQLLLVAIWAFFRYSKIGVAMRAVAADDRTALLMGISATRIHAPRT